jgi:hypothetical protein
MMQCPSYRIAAFLLASVVAAGAVFTAGCRKEPAAPSPSPSLSITGDQGSGTNSGMSQGPAKAHTGPAGKADTAPPLAVTADQVARDFQGDDKASGAKYSNRWLIVDGVYKEAYERKIGGTETRMVYFADYRDPQIGHTSHVGCKVDAASYPAFDGLTPGQKIKVKALCTGGGYQSVSLAEGKLEWADKDPAVEVSAAHLAGECAAHLNAARDRYTGRWLLVEGNVLQTNPKDRPTITLEGADEKGAKPFHVVAQFGLDRETDPAKVKKGDKVKLKGKVLALDGSSALLEDCKLVK